MKQKRERFGRIVQMHSNKREEVKEVRAGDIAAAIGLKDVTTGDTLCDQNHKVILERMEFPEPVIQIAVEPRSQADQEKMGIALGKLAAEDPSFRVETDDETGQTLISGMGELHLDIIVDRMKREFSVDCNVVNLKLRTAKQFAAAQKLKANLFANQVVVVNMVTYGLSLNHLKRVKGLCSLTRSWVVWFLRNTSARYRKGIEEQMNNGVLAGYPVLDVKATLYDGSYHDVDSSEMAFKIAGSMAFRKGALEAQPVLLEPMMKVEVTTPEDWMGDVVGDLNRRRGMIEGMDDGHAGLKIIRAQVPLSEMFGYATDLRSATQGRASYSMEFSEYAETPKNVADAIIAQRS